MNDTLDYFQACYGEAEGWLIVAVGREPHLDDAGRYTHDRWTERAVRWPSNADRAVKAIAAAAPDADVYAAPYLMRDQTRAKGNSASRALIHADVDHAKLDPAAVVALGGFAVASGTPGHVHVYIPLAYTVTRAQHQMLCRALAAHLGGDAKISDNDLLRPPGTWNHKAAAAGGAPTAVEWVVPYPGARVDPHALGVALGVDIAHAERERPPGEPGPEPPEQDPVDLCEHPEVAAALAENSGDRSSDTMRVAGACFDADLTLAQARWAARTREDLAQRLDEMLARRVPVDDLGKVWTKIEKNRQGEGNTLSPPETPAQPHTPWSGDAPRLAHVPHILDAVADEVGVRGLVGEEQLAKTLYLVFTSRLLDKQVSAGVKGHSASGKSYTVETVTKFFPPEALLVFTAMSERALVYSAEEYAHRTIVIYEVTALREGNEDDMTSYLLRSLLSEGRIDYDVTVKDRQSGGFTTKKIVKEGPTNLVFTTTKTKVHAENETRILSLATDDSREQTARVFAELADEKVSGGDMTGWHDLQRWLASAEHRVTVPYGSTLVRLIPPVAVRLRRDVASLLALIRTHAMLHQAHRPRDVDGRIVATVDDYAVVRDLVADVLSEGVGQTVSPTVREAVAAVAKLGAFDEGVTVRDLADELRLDRSTVARRLLVAADGGYLRNLEDKRGRPGRWVTDGPLPDAVDLLPSPAHMRTAETTADLWVCGCAAVSGGESND